jgi:sugar phosphate isomerase/epimerase
MSKIALQMYTCREHMKTAADFEETLKKVAEIGYEYVQISRPAFFEMDEMAKLLGKYDLQADSVFCPTGKILNNIEQLEKDADILGTDVVRTDSIPVALRTSREGYHEFAHRMDQEGQALKKAGLRYIYHFHAFEFVSFGNIRGIDILLHETDPEAVMFQPDVFWLTSAGTEPSVSLRMFKGRAFYMHVKDYAIRQLEGAIENVPFYFAPVGTGNLNWNGILQAANEIGIQRFVVEQDQVDGDVFEAIRTSYKNLQKMGIR